MHEYIEECKLEHSDMVFFTLFIIHALFTMKKNSSSNNNFRLYVTRYFLYSQNTKDG